MIVPVRNEPSAGNDGTYTFSGLLTPLPTGEAQGLIHIDVIVATNEFDFSTGAGPVLFDFLGNF